MDDSQKADLLSFIRDDGKGFIGIHSAAITFLSWPEYGKMLGGRFDGHPWGEFEAPLVVTDSEFPGMRHFPRTFTLRDEIYQIKDFARDDVRVLLRLDASRLDLSRKGVRRTDNDFAVIWARTYGKGRVLYNGLGHRQDVWERPDFQKMWQDQVRWSLGDLPGDASPRQAPRKQLSRAERVARQSRQPAVVPSGVWIDKVIVSLALSPAPDTVVPWLAASRTRP
jgi:uncharacterized protein